jgi:DNA mismatch repair protein MutL
MISPRSDRIHVLPVQLANQIAAGEVVERPASVIKELVENSLDAGASRIDIELRDGGKRLIRVLDNGRGIHVDDIELALTRHATSKLRALDDLQAISSLGFRGEALPSIASVSRFELCSRYHNSDKAWRVTVDAEGKISRPQPDAQPVGTWITVEELFCNTPARRRFLRSAKTEFVHVQDVIMRAALSRFDVTFSLRHNDKDVLRLAAITDEAMQYRRLGSVGGKAFMQAMHALDEERGGVRIHGWVAPAEHHRAQTDRQFIFINGRMVRDKVLMHAMRQAYGKQIPPGRYAMYAIYIELDPARIDVNVHPTKHEVRFREVRPVHDVLFSAVRHALCKDHPVLAIPAEHKLRARPYAGAVRESARVYALPQQIRASSAQSQLQVVSVLPGGYALVESTEAHWLYDIRKVSQHVFAARIERQQAAQGILHRPLLIPARVVLAEQAVNWLDDVHDALLQMAIDITRASETSVLLRGLPQAFESVVPDRFVHKLVEQQQLAMRVILDCASACLRDNETAMVIQSLFVELAEDEHVQCRRKLNASGLRAWYEGAE